jgi:hypothetical protein
MDRRHLATLLKLRRSCIYDILQAELSSGFSALGNSANFETTKLNKAFV